MRKVAGFDQGTAAAGVSLAAATSRPKDTLKERTRGCLKVGLPQAVDRRIEPEVVSRLTEPEAANSRPAEPGFEAAHMLVLAGPAIVAAAELHPPLELAVAECLYTACSPMRAEAMQTAAAARSSLNDLAMPIFITQGILAQKLP